MIFSYECRRCGKVFEENTKEAIQAQDHALECYPTNCDESDLAIAHAVADRLGAKVHSIYFRAIFFKMTPVNEEAKSAIKFLEENGPEELKLLDHPELFYNHLDKVSEGLGEKVRLGIKVLKTGPESNN